METEGNEVAARVGGSNPLLQDLSCHLSFKLTLRFGEMRFKKEFPLAADSSCLWTWFVGNPSECRVEALGTQCSRASGHCGFGWESAVSPFVGCRGRP